ncbi:glycosyltransferase family 4 protein [Verrucomicrobiales bacterium]|nr:glycosyltransferase family 4 protein [Verrucomicrobiales bacterium]MDB4358913.1 glycosyltransferase family 4 protein [Verrucomicrobiales bacterium]
MKVLILSQYFWPESFQINEIAKTLQEKGVEVEVLTGKPNYPQGEIYEGYRAGGCVREDHDNIPINRIPLLPRRSGGLGLILNYLSFVVTGLLIAPWVLRGKKFDAIFVYGVSPILQAIPALFLGRLKKCPVLLWVQDLWPESLSATGYVKNESVLKCVEYVVRFIYNHTDLLLVQSRGFEETVGKLASNTEVIYHPNSVDRIFSHPQESEAPEIEGLGEGFSVLFAGNMGAAQGLGVVVAAAEILKDYSEIRFVVVGDGSCREELIETSHSLGLSNVHAPGRFPVDMMPAFMDRASALMVSLVDRPIFSLTVPNKVQAYLAVGKPIIASLNGEGARIVEEAKAGLSTPAEDAAALADAVLKLYKMSESDRNELGENGRKYYEAHFDHDKLVDDLIGHFEAESAKMQAKL